MSDTTTNCGCSTSGCGIGGWNGPKPGDPSNTSRISAEAVTGGIRVSWTYPVSNPHAVAFYTLFRSQDSVFANALNLSAVAGGNYIDQMTVTEPKTFYYWIQMTSVNGTTETPIGPAQATARPFKQDVSDALAGSVGEALLDDIFKQDIQRITQNYSELTGRIGQLAANDATAALAWSDFQAGITQQLYYAYDKINVTIDGQTVLRTDMAAIALANRNAALLIENNRTMLVNQQNALYQETIARNLAFDNMSTAYKQEIREVANAFEARTNSLETWQSEANGRISSVQTGVSTLANKQGQFESTYFVKLSNGLLSGGFGIAAAAGGIAFGVYAHNFYIKDPGNPLANFTPFRVQGGKVYIQSAVIEEATIGTLHLANGAVSNMNANTNNSIRTVAAGGIINAVSTSISVAHLPTAPKTLIQATANLAWNMEYVSPEDGRQFFPPTAVYGEIVRNGTVLYQVNLGSIMNVNVMYVDHAPPEGTNTYTLNISNDSGFDNQKFNCCSASIAVLSMKK